jgi:hypothetical protein
MEVANTLAYYDTATIMVIKSFNGVDDIKLFFNFGPIAKTAF